MFSVKRVLFVCMLSLAITLSFNSLASANDFTVNAQSADSVKSDITHNHKIISEKPLYLKDADTDTWYENVKGNVLIEWNSKIPEDSLLKADLQVSDSLNYQFELVSAESSSDTAITGTFNIKKNGRLVASKIKGELYGLDAAEGDYFKFYSTGEKWHFSAFVTSRVDK